LVAVRTPIRMTFTGGCACATNGAAAAVLSWRLLFWLFRPGH
jgi:hypothetical protein